MATMHIEINPARTIRISNDGSSGIVGVGVGFAVGATVGLAVGF